ncbi:AMP-binding protein [Alkalilimnicola ehrlichii]|uniref:AMP-binding protein n=1 Tax=Alkalilimnicola ehrlichii TaxID=351052 RepID=UPI0026BE1BD2
MMRGLMMDRPLMISHIIEYAAANFPDQEVVSRMPEGGIHRYTYPEAAARSRQLANALRKLGVEPGDRVATVAWNTYRHFEIYYATSGIGAVCHTINPRLPVDQFSYIVNHAQDKYVFVDLTFVPLLEKLQGLFEGVRGYVIMTDREHMPETSLPDAYCYEDLLAEQPSAFEWPEFDEQAASSLCYTSGTTGNPKGVMYSHRSTLLHAFSVLAIPGLGLNETCSLLPVVPMFHVNAWGVPYFAPMIGAKLVFPGPNLDGASLTELMNAEGVTEAWGVPTVWMGLLGHLRGSGERLDSLQRVLIGGSAAPRAMMAEFKSQHGVEALQGWGMTEMSPVGTVSLVRPKDQNLPEEKQLDIKVTQGRAMFGVEMKSSMATASGCRTTVKPSASCWYVGLRLLAVTTRTRKRMLNHSTTRAGSVLATSRRSTPRGTWKSSIGRKTSLSPAANGSAPSTLRTKRSAIRKSPKRRLLPRITRNGTSGRCWSSCAKPVANWIRPALSSF